MQTFDILVLKAGDTGHSKSELRYLAADGSRISCEGMKRRKPINDDARDDGREICRKDDY